MTSISKNVYINKLDDIANEFNNPHPGRIKMKPIDVKPSSYIDFDAENNNKDPNFKFGGQGYNNIKELQKTNQTDFTIEKNSKEKS